VGVRVVVNSPEAQSRKSVDSTTKLLLGVGGVLLLVVVALLGVVAGRETADSKSTPAASSNSSSKPTGQYDYSILNDIRAILGRDYVKPDNLDDQTLYEAAINGLLNSLNDSGTYYLDPQTYKATDPPSGTFDGIGATISQQGNDIVVVTPIKNTPAEAAGIKAGDIILAVDGESTKGWNTEKTVAKIRGPKGTQVTIRIRHADTNQEVELTITRAPIQVESVSTEAPAQGMTNTAGQAVSNLGYIRIREFTQRTPGELDEAIKTVTSKGAKGIVLDLRGNPGGLLNSVISVADMFLDKGTIVTQRSKDGKEQSYTAKSGVSTNLPIVILQNKFSASASEVLAAALHDNGRATIVGDVSFGKATVNIARELKDGGVMFVSIAQWLTPNGGLIDKAGIQPDVSVIPTDQDIDQRKDPQLAKAVDILQGQTRANAGP
jgi:carboxyl-terminal processing protease